MGVLLLIISYLVYSYICTIRCKLCFRLLTLVCQGSWQMTQSTMWPQEGWCQWSGRHLRCVQWRCYSSYKLCCMLACSAYVHISTCNNVDSQGILWQLYACVIWYRYWAPVSVKMKYVYFATGFPLTDSLLIIIHTVYWLLLLQLF